MEGQESSWKGGRVLWAFSGYHGNPEVPTLNTQTSNCRQAKLASRPLPGALKNSNMLVFSPPQDLQRHIEQRAESVASVLTLCDVLLRDADACGSDSEGDSIQQTSRSLDRRWRNICAMSMERRMR